MENAYLFFCYALCVILGFVCLALEKKCRFLDSRCDTLEAQYYYHERSKHPEKTVNNSVDGVEV